MAQTHENIKKLEPTKLTESIKSMEWGTQDRHRYTQELQHSHNRQQGHIILVNRVESYEGHTHQSMSNPFKKHKNGQFDKLNQLKKEYEILKNIHIEDELTRQRKSSVQMSKNSQTSSSASLVSEPSKSVYSRTHTHKTQQPHIEIHEFERKQLEMMLSNSMAKVEQLLKIEVQYKKKIHQLTQKASIFKEDESRATIAQFEEKERSLHGIISGLKLEDERLRNINRELAHRVGQLEGDIAFKDGQIRKLNEQKRRHEQSYLLEREKLLNNQIQVKRTQMEKEILEKQKNSQISRLQNLLSATAGAQTFNVDMERLREEVRLKDERYSLLVKELEAVRSARPSEDILHKLDNLEEVQESTIKKEIDILKQEFVRLRDNHESHNIHALHHKIQLFQKIVDEENYHKMQLMHEIKELSEDYQRLKRENSKLESELQKAQLEYRRVKKELGGLKNDLDVSDNARVNLSVSHLDQNAMINKIKNTERLQENYEELKTEYNQLKKLSKLRQSDSDSRIRELLRKIDELEFEVERLQKQNTFNLGLAAAKSKADLELMQNSESRAFKERDEWKRQFHNMKIFYEQKLEELRAEANRVGEEYTFKCYNQENIIKELRKGIDQDLQTLRLKNQSEQAILLKRLESLTESNERLAQQNSSLIHFEGELHQLRQHQRLMKGMNENVEHLWMVKEQEYANVNDLLKELQESQ